MKKVNIATTIMFSLFLASFAFINIFTPVRHFSELENRYLAQIPNFSYRNLRLGRFTEGIENFVTDQFFLRDQWVLLKSDLERLTLKRENNGVFIGTNGFLLENYKGPNQNLISNIDKINEFHRTFPELDINFLLAPNSVEIYREKLPPFAATYSQEKVYKRVLEILDTNVSFIDPTEILKEKSDRYIYFSTDHHWTMEGAYYAYNYASNYLGFNPYSKQHFSVDTVNKSFMGTYSSKANTRIASPDYIDIFRPLFNVKYKVWYGQSDKATDSFYSPSHLDTKDKYSYFLDGNHPLVVIKSDVETHRKLLVFKDSYAHSFLPFLANHYDEIHIVDLRYFNSSVTEYIENNNIEEVLFLFNVSTFSQTSQLLNIRY